MTGAKSPQIQQETGTMTEQRDKSPSYKRVLLKVSGEALMGKGSGGVDPEMVDMVAADIAAVVASGVQVCLVVGGGNIFRGLSAAARGMDRAQGDYAGMLATVINALMLQNGLERQGLETRVMTAIQMAAIAEPYIRRRAVRHMEKGRVGSRCAWRRSLYTGYRSRLIASFLTNLSGYSPELTLIQKGTA